MANKATNIAENKRREDINLKLLTKFYTEQDIITNAAVDKFPSGAYLDPKLPYTQTGIMSIIEYQL